MKEAFKGNSKPQIKDFDELIQQILKKLFNYLNNNIFAENERNAYGTICLNILAAFLCHLGRNFNKQDAEKCKEKYLSNADERQVQIYLNIKSMNFGVTTLGTLASANLGW
uniref:WAPL domain-containing protein n=1 Tax=Meloidogyne hapla TaxID=6305 RepID=A0A1I8B7R5_MELHA